MSSEEPGRTGHSGPPARLPRAVWAAAFALAALVLGLAFGQLKGVRPGSGSLSEPLAPAPEFQLTDQTGRPFTRADLLGHVWIANFIFTRCQGPCPALTSRMQELNAGLARADGVRLVSFTMDPSHDTPAVLSEYGLRAGADPARWKFLTGPEGLMDEVVTKGFLQPAVRPGSGDVAHSTRFVVVDRNGWIRSFRDGNDPEVVQKVLSDVGDLLREPGKS